MNATVRIIFLASRCSRSSKRLALTVALLSICIFSLAVPSSARSWRIADYQDNIAIAQDGSANVSERITLVFIGSFQGIHRRIPIEYPGPGDTNFTLFLNITGIHDGDGNSLKYEASTSGGWAM